MLTPFRCASSLVVLVLCALLGGVCPVVPVPGAWAAGGGVRNPGFEVGPAATGEAAQGWTIVTQAVTGNVTRIQRDDAATYPVFGTVNGGTVVSPRTGAWMLRFGIPKGTDAHQAKGMTTVVQTFTSDGSDVGVAFRIFTWEHRDTDAFVIDVTDASGRSVGRLADKEIQDLTGTSVVMGAGTLPYTLTLKVEPRQVKYKDTGWQDVRITGLSATAGQTLTIRYTLDTNTNASHDSWVYLDMADVVPPVVSITSPADGALLRTDPVLDFTASDEAGGSGLASVPAVVKVDGAIVGVTSGSVLGGLSEGEHSVAVTAADVAGNKGTATATFTLDKTSPQTTASGSPAANAAGWNSGLVTVTLTAADGTGTGVAGTYYTINGGSQQTYSAAAKPVLTADGDAITYWSVDRAGNAETAKTFAVRIDATPPPPVTVGGTAPAPNAAGWNGGPVTLTIAAGAGASGLALVESRLDDGAWTPVVPLAGAYRLVVSGDGRHAVGYRSVSVAGMTSVAGSCEVNIDGAAPQVAISSPADGASLEEASPALVYTAADPLSGLADGYPQVTLDGGVIVVAPGGVLPALGPGSHTLQVTALDSAGNETSATSTFTVRTSTTLSAEFEAAPERPYEGDIVGLYAADSGSEEGKTWEWTVSADGVQQATLEGPVAFLTLADAGPYDVKLTVTDTATQTTHTTTQTVSAAPHAPWVTALDVEVLDGEPAKLAGRFLDPGWEQAHHAMWSVTDALGNEVAPVGATVFEDNFPAMDSGFVEGLTPPLDADHGPYTGHLSVTDSTGSSTTVDFQVTVVSPNPDADEGQPGSDTITGLGDSPEARGGRVHLSYIQATDDVDIFEVRTPSGDPLPYGTEVLVTLRDLPQDYDVALIQDLGAEVDANAGLEGASVSSAAAQSYVDAPVRRGTEWDGSPVRRGTDWYDLPVRRGTDWSDLPVRRGTDWWDLPVRRGTEWDGSPVRRGTPFIESVYLDSPVRRGTDWEAIPVRRGTEWEGIPVRRGTEYVRPPLLSMLFDRLSLTKESLDGYSFLDMGFTGLGSNTASGSTVDFAALGFDNAALKGKRIADVSAHAGTGSETVYAETTFANGRTYIAVKGANGAFSEEQPYALQVETSLPLSIYDKLDDAGITEPVVVGADQRTTQAETPVVRPADAPGPLTLFVTQAERIDALYGDSTYSDTPEGRPFVHTVLPTLEAACNDQDGLVRGEVLSVPSSFYDAWDATPWSTTEANAVAERIRALIQAYLSDHPTIKYVVLVGSDDIVPQRRVLDQTVLANEKDYYQRSWLRAKGAVAASMFDGTVLTDDYYVDAQPIPYNGRELFVPDVAVSRLVETPAQIEGVIDRFLEARGTLNGGSSVVTGQDFMVDGAQRVWNILDAADLDPVMETPESWTVADLQRDLLSGQKNVGAINAHFTHYGGISAAGYNDQSLTGEFLTSTAIRDATEFTGKLVFTMGCHAGLSVPDDQGNVAAEYAGDLDPRLDIAQAMAIRQGVLVGSTGYGYGDSEGIAGTEALVGTFADQATASDADSPAVPGTAVSTPGRPETGQPIGLALAAAKRQYLGSLNAVTPYDEKSSIEFTMYGMPQYRLPCETHEPTQGLQSSGVNPQSASYDGHLEPRPFALTVVDAGEPERTFSATLMESSVDPTARYLTADGDSQATFGRPIQPRVVIDLGAAGGDPVKSAIVTGGTYVDVPAFDPAISRWTYEWEVAVKELQVSTDGWWPEKPVVVRTIGSGADVEQRLIVLPGQFLATSAAGAPVVGTERVWTSLEVELVRGPAADTTPPTVSSVTLTRADDTAPVVARVAAADAAGIARIDVTQVGTSPAAHVSVPVGGSGPFDAAISLPGVAADDVALTVAVVDAAGNTTTVTSKGALVTLSGPSGTMVLNGGATQTYNAVVAVDSSGVSGATEMRTSTDGTNWTPWRAFAADSLVALSGLPGSKTVYAQYRNAQGVLDKSSSVTLAPASVDAGANQGIVVKSDGTLWAWGDNSSGQLGDGTTVDKPTPTQAGADTHWATVSTGYLHSLALKSDGTLWAWGRNEFGQLGDGLTVDKTSPIRIGSDSDWVGVSSGAYHSLGLKNDGTIWAWGSNDFGQLGDNSIVAKHVPTRVGSDSDWVAVSAGGNHSLALKSDGTLWAWGMNDFGELGDNTKVRRPVPTRIGADSDWVSVSGGAMHTHAIRSDGTLWGWGSNLQGQMGDGATPESLVPTQIGTDSHWLTVTAGYMHSLAVKDDGTLWAWGSNGNGQLGDGTTDFNPIPAQIGSGTDWAVVSEGDFHSFALKSDGTVWAWGRNLNGQLGDGTTTDSHVPKEVFSLTAPTVTSPNGSESWVIGEAHDITWAPGSGGAVTIELSRDNGGGWETLFASTANDGTESWTVGGAVTGQALVRISNATGADASNADFTIGLFAAKVDYTTGAGPESVAAGDVNGDGTQDVATANLISNSVSVLLGNGDGTFAAKVDYATGAGPCSVSVGDVNGDGRQDLATANNSADGVSVLLGNGDGTFAARVDYATGATPFSVVVGDVNGDGRQDLATANLNGNSVSVLLGNGDGTFAAKVDYATGAPPCSVVVGDFNGDGRQDLATANNSADSVSVLLGNGDGTFAAKVDHATGSAPRSVAVGDVNGDGRQDLATANLYGDSVSVLLGNGDGTFAAKVDHATGARPCSVVVGDVNGDGRRDLAAANESDDSVSVLLNATPAAGLLQFAAKVDYAAGAVTTSVDAGDFNGDGAPDLVAANWNVNTVSVLLGSGSGTFAAAADCATGALPRSVAVGDFNGDGKQDLAAANAGGNTVSLLLGSGDGTFATKIDHATGNGPFSVAAGDFNRDGRPDLVTANSSGGTVSVLLGSGSGTLAPHADYAIGLSPYSVAVGDFNGDGKQDLAAANYGGAGLSVLLGSGDGTFAAKVDYATGPGPQWVAVGDFNGDGRQDLASASRTGNSISILLGYGDGTFAGNVDYATGAGPRAVAVGDFNGDGRQDLAAADGSATRVSILLGNGDGTFAAKLDYATGTQPAAIAVGDYNGDGRQDLAVANSAGNSVSVLLNTTAR